MAGDAKDKIMILFKTNTTENYIKPTRVNNVYEVQTIRRESRTE